MKGLFAGWGVRILAAMVIAVAAFFAGRATAEADHFQNTRSHWARVDGQPLVLGIKTVFLPPDEQQALANAAAGWSLHPLIEIGIVGEGDPALCGEDGGPTVTMDVGYVLVCHYPFDYTPYLAPDTNFAQWVPQAWAGCDLEQPFEVGNLHKNQCEFGTWHEIVHHTDGSLRMQHPCHELAHVLGFRDYTSEEKDSGQGGGCLGGANTTAEFECPSAKDFAHLSDLYAHADSHTTAGPTPGQWVVQGVTTCAQFVGAQPTPVPSATLFPTATPSPVATQCAWPTWHWKCGRGGKGR